MTSAPILLTPPEHRWVCTRCTHTDVTQDARPHTRFHACRGMAGLTMPMTPDGQRCKVEVHEREDYIAGELVQRDGNGRPIMSVEVTRDDGTDVAVFAPQAQVEMG